MKVSTYIIIFALSIFILVPFFSGCNIFVTPQEETATPTFTPTEVIVEEVENPILINDGEKYTNSPIVNLTLSAPGASYMILSGDGSHWSDWLEYKDHYDEFDLFHGPGCTKKEGTRKVFVKFKYPDENIKGPYFASIVLDMTPPYLKYVRWIDTNANFKIDTGDILKIGFSESMDTSTITIENVSDMISIGKGREFSIEDISWNNEGTELSIIIKGEIDFGAAIVPNKEIKDLAGNSIDTSITLVIPYTTHHKLDHIEVNPTSITVSRGDSPVKITVKAYDTRGEDITNLCTFSWSFVGTSSGTLSSSSGNTVYYIPPSSEEPTATATATSTATATPTETPTPSPTPTPLTDIIHITASHGNDPTITESIFVTIN